MALKRFVTISEVGIFGPYNLDPTISPFGVSIQVVVPDGTTPPGVAAVTAAYSVEFTLDDLELTGGIMNPHVVWLTDPQFPAGSSMSITGNYIVPVSAVRVNVTALAGGSIALKIRQGDVIH